MKGKLAAGFVIPIIELTSLLSGSEEVIDLLSQEEGCGGKRFGGQRGTDKDEGT